MWLSGSALVEPVGTPQRTPLLVRTDSGAAFLERLVEALRRGYVGLKWQSVADERSNGRPQASTNRPNPESLSSKGIPATRPARFELATSRSGGGRRKKLRKRKKRL
jgi:hypothetical protein